MTKTAIITGAAKNIGKGIAKGLLEAGYSCVLLDNDESALTETVQALSSYGACQDFVIDMADLDAINVFIEWLKKEQRDVGVLINNVGYESEKSVLSLTTGAIKESCAVNQTGPFYLTSQIARLMTDSKNDGSIIFITSTHSSVTRMHPLYSSSKAAIEMFMKETALELAAPNIRVNAIAPGPVIETEDLQANKYVPMGYSLQPKDVAECVSFLISDKARFITGQTIVVDGGFSVAHTHFWKQSGQL